MNCTTFCSSCDDLCACVYVYLPVSACVPLRSTVVCLVCLRTYERVQTECQLFSERDIKMEISHGHSCVRTQTQHSSSRPRLLLPLFFFSFSPLGQCDLHLSQVSLFNIHEEDTGKKKKKKRRLRRKPTDARGRRRNASKKVKNRTKGGEEKHGSIFSASSETFLSK